MVRKNNSNTSKLALLVVDGMEADLFLKFPKNHGFDDAFLVEVGNIKADMRKAEAEGLDWAVVENNGSYKLVWAADAMEGKMEGFFISGTLDNIAEEM